jgi:adsorption protein A
LRASASFLNGGRHSDDWHPARNGWLSRNLYVDAAHYLKGNISALAADYRTGYHRRISAGQTLEPYWHMQFTVTRNVRVERDSRTGFGVRWNVWHGDTRYDAAPHKVTVGMEFQQAVETYLSDRRGLFFTVGTRW